MFCGGAPGYISYEEPAPLNAEEFMTIVESLT